MPRPSSGPRHSIHVRVPADLYAELVLLRPELQDPNGSTKYGALNNYFLRLIREDLDRHTSWIKAQMKGAPA